MQFQTASCWHLKLKHLNLHKLYCKPHSKPRVNLSPRVKLLRKLPSFFFHTVDKKQRIFFLLEMFLCFFKQEMALREDRLTGFPNTHTYFQGCLTHTLPFALDGRRNCCRRIRPRGEGHQEVFMPTTASTSSSGCSVCHWAMGLRGLASMSDQWRNSAPVALHPTKTFPIASFLPSLS